MPPIRHVRHYSPLNRRWRRRVQSAAQPGIFRDNVARTRSSRNRRKYFLENARRTGRCFQTTRLINNIIAAVPDGAPNAVVRGYRRTLVYARARRQSNDENYSPKNEILHPRTNHRRPVISFSLSENVRPVAIIKHRTHATVAADQRSSTGVRWKGTTMDGRYASAARRKTTTN